MCAAAANRIQSKHEEKSECNINIPQQTTDIRHVNETHIVFKVCYNPYNTFKL